MAYKIKWESLVAAWQGKTPFGDFLIFERRRRISGCCGVCHISEVWLSSSRRPDMGQSGLYLFQVVVAAQGLEGKMNIGDKVQDHGGRDFVIKAIETVKEPEAASMAKRGWIPIILTLQGRERCRTAYVDAATGEIRCMVNVDRSYPGRFE